MQIGRERTFLFACQLICGKMLAKPVSQETHQNLSFGQNLMPVKPGTYNRLRLIGPKLGQPVQPALLAHLLQAFFRKPSGRAARMLVYYLFEHPLGVVGFTLFGVNDPNL